MLVSVEVVSIPVLRNADIEQAEYFCRLFGGMKSQVCELLEMRLDEMVLLQRAGDLAAVRRHRHIVNQLESELRTLDQLLLKLRIRLGLPTLRRSP